MEAAPHAQSAAQVFFRALQGKAYVSNARLGGMGPIMDHGRPPLKGASCVPSVDGQVPIQALQACLTTLAGALSAIPAQLEKLEKMGRQVNVLTARHPWVWPLHLDLNNV